MNIAFAGVRHVHILEFYEMAKKNKKVNIVGAFEENEAAKQFAQKNYGMNFNYKSYKDILSDSGIDAVAIGDFYQKRGQMIIDALNAGKHIICDKPLCIKLSELYEIQKLSEEKNLVISCMLDLRYMPCIAKVKEIIQQGEIGDIKIVSFTGQHFLDYQNRPRWYFEKGKHGGTINDIAIHGVDLLRFITGKDISDIEYAKTWNAFAKDEPDFYDSGQFILNMGDIRVMADVSYAAPGYVGILPTYWRFEFWGSEGMLSFNFLESNKVKVYKKNEQVIECEQCPTDYLNDFINEIKEGSKRENTKSVIASCEQTLKIQKYADDRRKQ